jgi:hypothetical protein
MPSGYDMGSLTVVRSFIAGHVDSKINFRRWSDLRTASSSLFPDQHLKMSDVMVLSSFAPERTQKGCTDILLKFCF